MLQSIAYVTLKVKLYFVERPKPTHEFAVETLVEFLRGKNALPCVIELGKGVNYANFPQSM
jgi:hypothetical protein